VRRIPSPVCESLLLSNRSVWTTKQAKKDTKQASGADKYVGEERTNLHVDASQRTALIEGMRGAVVYGTAEKAGLSTLPIFIFGKDRRVYFEQRVSTTRLVWKLCR
jgi:hypothetical protein